MPAAWRDARRTPLGQVLYRRGEDLVVGSQNDGGPVKAMMSRSAEHTQVRGMSDRSRSLPR